MSRRRISHTAKSADAIRPTLKRLGFALGVALMMISGTKCFADNPSDRSTATLSATKAVEGFHSIQGAWLARDGAICSQDRESVYARGLVPGLEWTDCILEATVTIESALDQPWAGLRLIVRSDAAASTFTTVGLWMGDSSIVIEQVEGMVFRTLEKAPFPLVTERPYGLKVITDRAGVFVCVDGEFVMCAVEPHFLSRPRGAVGFYSAAATGLYSDITVRPTERSRSPFRFHQGNPLNIDAYSPTVLLDAGRYRMWFTNGQGQGYAESTDGVSWSRPAGTGSVKPLGATGEWGDAGEADAEVIWSGSDFLMSHPASSSAYNKWWDGMGFHRSKDGIHWTAVAGNPLFYMGPTGAWDEHVVGDHGVIRDGGVWKMWFTGINHPERGYRNEFGYAESEDGLHWRVSTLNPVLCQGDPGDWDGGWIYAASVIKLGDTEETSRVYRGEPGATYHCFYTGQPTNNEMVSGVKRIGWAFSLDGIHWTKYNDPATQEPPFHQSDPVLTWTEWEKWGYVGTRACSAILDGDEVKIWTSGEGGAYQGTGLATARVADLLEIVEEAKRMGKLVSMPRREIESTLVERLPRSTWDDLAEHARQATKQMADDRPEEARKAMEVANGLLARMNASERLYLETHLASLKQTLDHLDQTVREPPPSAPETETGK